MSGQRFDELIDLCLGVVKVRRRTKAAFAEGVTDYITKPFAVAQMRARVRSWLSRSAEVEK